jgi:hypothetical protein
MPAGEGPHGSLTRRLECPTHIATTISAGVAGVVLIGGCVTFIDPRMMGKSGGATGLIIGFISLPLALYLLRTLLQRLKGQGLSLSLNPPADFV